jgi:amidase
LYGIRPTHGRVDLTGAMPMAPSFDVAGWFANGPGLFRKVGAVLLEGMRGDAPVTRAIVMDDAFAEADPDVVKLLNTALSAMSSALPVSQHERIAPELDVWRENFRILQGREMWAVYGDFITRHKPNLGPGVRERLQFASTISERDADTARRAGERARERIRSLAAPGTVLVLPTSPSIAPLIDAEPGEYETFRLRTMRLTCISGLSGLPQISIPVGIVSGCPVGLSLIGWAGGDEALLDLSVRVSRFCGLQG